MKQTAENLSTYASASDEMLDSPKPNINKTLGITALMNTEPVQNSGAKINSTVHQENLVPWQTECLENIRHSKNVILSSPTGSGKTAVFMEWAREKKESAEDPAHHRVYITSPLISLSNERFDDMKKQGYKVGIETGDCKYVPDDCDYICCTQEIFTNQHTNDNNSTLIVDEFHYIFENPERQRAYIDGLKKTKAENILLCSATFGDVQKLNQQVNKISHREFQAYENHERLTDLEYKGFIPQNDIKDALVIAFSQKNCNTIAKTLAYNRQRAFQDLETDESNAQAFAKHSEKVREICRQYNTHPNSLYDWGIASYYGAKLPKEKLCIEKLFHEHLLDTVVATDALALGVNLPVDKVVFAQTYKRQDGVNYVISKNLFDQLAGRAGRKSYFDKGSVYYNNEFYNDNGYAIDSYIKETFENLKQAKNESANFYPTPLLGPILRGESTVQEEAEYIVENSTMDNNQDNLNRNVQEISWQIQEIRNHEINAYADITVNEAYNIRHPDLHRRKLTSFESEGVLAVPFPSEADRVDRYVTEFEHDGIKVEVFKQTFGPEYSDPSYDDESLVTPIRLYLENNQTVTLYCIPFYSEDSPLRYTYIQDYDPSDSKNELYEKAQASDDDFIVPTEIMRAYNRLSAEGHFFGEYNYDSFDDKYSGDDEFEDGNNRFKGSKIKFSIDSTISFLYDIDQNDIPTEGTMGFFAFEDGQNFLARRTLQSQYRIKFSSQDQLWHLEPEDQTFSNNLLYRDFTTNDYIPEENLAKVEQKINAAWQTASTDAAQIETRRAQVKAEYKYMHDKLQKEFNENISLVYNDQLSPEENCTLFEGILSQPDPIAAFVTPDSPIKNLLNARKYFRNLPRNYRKNLNLAQLDDWINARDETILNRNRGLISTTTIKTGVNYE